MGFHTEIEIASAEAAKVYSIDEEKRKGFIQGAYWLLRQLEIHTSFSQVELTNKGAHKYCEQLRLSDIRSFISEMYQHTEPSPADKDEK